MHSLIHLYTGGGRGAVQNFITLLIVEYIHLSLYLVNFLVNHRETHACISHFLLIYPSHNDKTHFKIVTFLVNGNPKVIDYVLSEPEIRVG